MKKITTFALLTIGFAGSVMAAEYKGFVMDEKCSTVAAMKGDAACAQKCVKGGSPAVLVTDDGKVYKIANQDKVMASVGQTVTVNGKLKGDTLTVASLK
jgi:hypothetical protein